MGRRIQATGVIDLIGAKLFPTLVLWSAFHPWRLRVVALGLVVGVVTVAAVVPTHSDSHPPSPTIVIGVR